MWHNTYMESARNKQLEGDLVQYYKDHSELLFHGWHHISFVTRKALEFADEFNGINREYVEAAALTHDLNYLVDTTTEVEAGKELRKEHLTKVGYNQDEINILEKIVYDGTSIHSGNENISNESKALSDADKLFKVLPVGPIILSGRYITETKVNLHTWAERIIRYQKPLLDNGTYFWTTAAKDKYLDWARLNLAWVEQVQDSLSDPDIQSFLEDCKKLGYL